MDAYDNAIIRGHEPKDIEYIISRHRELYATEYNFGEIFGDYVEKYVLKFNDCNNCDKERMWIAEHNSKPIGMIALVKADDSTAQLRWFLLEPEARGHGLGSKLMKTALSFAEQKNYKRVFLWTVSTLEPARNLYKRFGFALTEAKPCEWAPDANEERWDKEI